MAVSADIHRRHLLTENALVLSCVFYKQSELTSSSFCFGFFCFCSENSTVFSLNMLLYASLHSFLPKHITYYLVKFLGLLSTLLIFLENVVIYTQITFREIFHYFTKINHLFLLFHLMFLIFVSI